MSASELESPPVPKSLANVKANASHPETMSAAVAAGTKRSAQEDPSPEPVAKHRRSAAAPATAIKSEPVLSETPAYNPNSSSTNTHHHINHQHHSSSTFITAKSNANNSHPTHIDAAAAKSDRKNGAHAQAPAISSPTASVASKSSLKSDESPESPFRKGHIGKSLPQCAQFFIHFENVPRPPSSLVQKSRLFVFAARVHVRACMHASN